MRSRKVALIKEAQILGATHVISVQDTFNDEDYPAFVMESDDLQEVRKRYDNINMQRINYVLEVD